jgi:hypothetical protein
MLNKAPLHEDVWRREGTALRILNLGTIWKSVGSFTSLPLYPQYPLDRRLGGPQSRCGRGGEEKNSFPSYSENSPNTVKASKSRKLGWAIHVNRKNTDSKTAIENGVQLRDFVDTVMNPPVP